MSSFGFHNWPVNTGGDRFETVQYLHYKFSMRLPGRPLAVIHPTQPDIFTYGTASPPHIACAY